MGDFWSDDNVLNFDLVVDYMVVLIVKIFCVVYVLFGYIRYIIYNLKVLKNKKWDVVGGL